jgi:hypothetical protein
MKKIFGLLIILAGFVLAVEPIEGFRDMKFGDPIEKLGKDKVFIGTSLSKTSVYNRPTDSLMIGDMKLKSITYGFCNGKLCQVSCFFENNGDIEEMAFKKTTLYFALIKKYGEPVENDFTKTNNINIFYGVSGRDRNIMLLGNGLFYEDNGLTQEQRIGGAVNDL